MEIINHPFQGVACCCFDTNNTHISETLNKLLDLNLKSVTHHEITSYELKLSNKYYETTIHLFDNNSLLGHDLEKRKDVYNQCQAIILYGDGKTLTVEQLDRQLDDLSGIGGEPRLLLYHGIDSECEPYKTLSDWSLKNGFDFIDTCDDETKDQIIDSLSAYKWKYRLSSANSDSGNKKSFKLRDTKTEKKETNGNGGDSSKKIHETELNDETMKKLMDFDNLLGKLSAYRDRPELRGNMDDGGIVEIAEILSNLLGEDADNFLDNEDEKEDFKEGDNTAEVIERH